MIFVMEQKKMVTFIVSSQYTGAMGSLVISVQAQFRASVLGKGLSIIAKSANAKPYFLGSGIDLECWMGRRYSTVG